MEFAQQFAAELHNVWLFVQTIGLVMVYTGFIVVPVAALVRALFQAYLARNVAQRGWTGNTDSDSHKL